MRDFCKPLIPLNGAKVAINRHIRKYFRHFYAKCNNKRAKAQKSSLRHEHGEGPNAASQPIRSKHGNAAPPKPHKNATTRESLNHPRASRASPWHTVCCERARLTVRNGMYCRARYGLWQGKTGLKKARHPRHEDAALFIAQRALKPFRLSLITC